MWTWAEHVKLCTNSSQNSRLTQNPEYYHHAAIYTLLLFPNTTGCTYFMQKLYYVIDLKSNRGLCCMFILYLNTEVALGVRDLKSNVKSIFTHGNLQVFRIEVRSCLS